MKQPIFTLPNGDLSAYSFACGYIQRHTVKGAEIQLYMEHAHYHVMFITVQKCAPYIGCLGVETDEVRDRKEWDTFETLTPARKKFAAYKSIANKEYK